MMTKTRCLLLLQWSFGKYTWQFFVVFLFFAKKAIHDLGVFYAKKVGVFCFKKQNVIILILWKKFTFLKLLIVVEIVVYIF